MYCADLGIPCWTDIIPCAAELHVIYEQLGNKRLKVQLKRSQDDFSPDAGDCEYYTGNGLRPRSSSTSAHNRSGSGGGSRNNLGSIGSEEPEYDGGADTLFPHHADGNQSGRINSTNTAATTTATATAGDVTSHDAGRDKGLVTEVEEVEEVGEPDAYHSRDSSLVDSMTVYTSGHTSGATTRTSTPGRPASQNPIKQQQLQQQHHRHHSFPQQGFSSQDVRYHGGKGEAVFSNIVVFDCAADLAHSDSTMRQAVGAGAKTGTVRDYSLCRTSSPDHTTFPHHAATTASNAPASDIATAAAAAAAKGHQSGRDRGNDNDDAEEEHETVTDKKESGYHEQEGGGGGSAWTSVASPRTASSYDSVGSELSADICSTDFSQASTVVATATPPTAAAAAAAAQILPPNCVSPSSSPSPAIAFVAVKSSDAKEAADCKGQHAVVSNERQLQQQPLSRRGKRKTQQQQRSQQDGHKHEQRGQENDSESRGGALEDCIATSGSAFSSPVQQRS